MPLLIAVLAGCMPTDYRIRLSENQPHSGSGPSPSLPRPRPGQSAPLLLLLATVPAFLATRHVLRSPRVAPQIFQDSHLSIPYFQPDEPFELPASRFAPRGGCDCLSA
jgi:hypothetical protein